MFYFFYFASSFKADLVWMRFRVRVDVTELYFQFKFCLVCENDNVQLEMATTDTNGIDCIRKAKLRRSFPCNLHLLLVVI